MKNTFSREDAERVMQWMDYEEIPIEIVHKCGRKFGDVLSGPSLEECRIEMMREAMERGLERPQHEGEAWLRGVAPNFWKCLPGLQKNGLVKNSGPRLYFDTSAQGVAFYLSKMDKKKKWPWLEVKEHIETKNGRIETTAALARRSKFQPDDFSRWKGPLGL